MARRRMEWEREMEPDGPDIDADMGGVEVGLVDVL